MASLHQLFKVILVTVCSTVFLCLTIPIGLARLYRGQIIAEVRTQFARQSDQILDDFEVSLSLARHFPRITLTLTNLSVLDTHSTKPLPVLSIERADLSLDINDLLGNAFQVQSLTLRGVRFHQWVDATGTKVALRFKPASSRATHHPLSFTISQVDIQLAAITTENLYKGNSVAIFIHQARLRANLKGEVLVLEGELADRIRHITSKSLVLFREKPFTAIAHYTFHLTEKTGTFERTQVKVNGAQLTISGHHTRLPAGQGSLLDLQISGSQPTTYVLNEVIPVLAKPYFEGITSRSKLFLRYRLSGQSGPKVRPHSQLSFQLSNGILVWPKTGIRLTDVLLKGELDNGKEHSPQTTSLNIHQLTARCGKGTLELRGKLVNFQHPSVTGSLKWHADLAQLADLLQLPHPESYRGRSRLLAEVSNKPGVPKGKHLETDLIWKGRAQLSNASFQAPGLAAECTDLNGELTLQDNLIRLRGVRGKLAGEPFNVDATVRDLLQYGLGYRRTVTIEGSLWAHGIHTGWFFNQPDTPLSRNVRPTDTLGPDFIVPPFLRIRSAVRCEQLILPADTLRNLSALVSFDSKQLDLRQLSLKACGGAVQLLRSQPGRSAWQGPL